MVTFTKDLTSVTVRNPDLEDSRIRWPKTAVRWSMSNVAHSFVKKPLNSLIDLSFTLFRCNSQMASLVSFLEDTRGVSFTYVDHLSVSHTVKLTSGEYTVTQLGGDVETISITLEEV